jgi:hypothetical protein
VETKVIYWGSQRELDLCDRILENIDDEMISVNPTTAVAVIPTVFDHVCERLGLNKPETMKVIASLNEKMNEEEGAMYG